MAERGRTPWNARPVSCELVCETVSALLDGEVPPLQPDAAAAHVAGCVECRDFQSRVGSLSRGLRVHAYVPTPQPSAELFESLGCPAGVPASVPASWTRRAHRGHQRLVRATQWAAAIVPVCVTVPALALGVFAHVHVVGTMVPAPCIASIPHAIGHR